MRSEVTGSYNTWSTERHPEITAGKREKGKRWGFGLEKTSRKKLTAVAFGGRQVTKTKAQQNYIPRRVAGEQRNGLSWGTGKGTMG